MDPTLRFERDGLPGPLSAFALESVWKRSKDPRFHPMNRRWCHSSFWNSTMVDVYKFEPMNYTLPPSLEGVRLWPPSTRTPRGRPRMKPLKKGRSAMNSELKKFEEREHNKVFASGAHVRGGGTCSKCGSKGHNSRSCKSATMGDIFKRQLTVEAQLHHVHLPLPPPDSYRSWVGPTPSLASTVEDDGYVGAPVLKWFSCKECASGRRQFSGICKGVSQTEGRRMYRIQYDDNDVEDVTLSELKDIMVAL